MAMQTRDYHIKINDGTDTHKFQLLRQREGLAWRVTEQPVTPAVAENAAQLSFESLPAERLLSFAMKDWSGGDGLHEFLPGKQDELAINRYETGENIDSSIPGRLRHGPEKTTIGTIANPAQQFIFFDSKVYILTTTHLYSWDATTLVDKTSGLTSANQCVEYNGKLYVAAGGSTGYATWDGTTLVTSPTLADPGASSTKSHFFAVKDKRLYVAYDDNSISYIDDPAATSWSPAVAITVGQGSKITNMFVMSDLLLVATEETIYIIDSDDVVHEINQVWRNAPSDLNFAFAASSGSEAWVSNEWYPDLFRIIGAGFNEFVIVPSSPRFSSRRRPVNFKDLRLLNIFAPALTFDALFLHVHIPSTASDTTGHVIRKAVDAGGSELAWDTIARFTTGIFDDVSTLTMNVLRLAAEDAAYAYMCVETSGSVFTITRIPVDRWPNSSVPASDFAATWSMTTPFFDANLSTWDKVWWRIRVEYEKVGDGILGTLEVLARTSEDAAFTSIGTISGTDGIVDSTQLKTFATATPFFAGQRVQLQFKGTANNSNQDGVDLRAFSLEGILKPEYLRLYDMTLVVRNKTEADFIVSLRTKNVSLTLTDRFDVDRTVFVVPGSPTEQELIDDHLKEPVRVYHLLLQDVPPAS